jgi:hypothetical protein
LVVLLEGIDVKDIERYATRLKIRFMVVIEETSIRSSLWMKAKMKERWKKRRRGEEGSEKGREKGR